MVLDTSHVAILAGDMEGDRASEQLNHRISRLVLLESLIAFREILKAAIISEGVLGGGGGGGGLGVYGRMGGVGKP